MGDIGTPHHGACYRVFDVSREILAHDYSIADPGAHAADPTVWQLALEEAQHLQNRPTPGG
jgi:hypothetical protein